MREVAPSFVGVPPADQAHYRALWRFARRLRMPFGDVLEILREVALGTIDPYRGPWGEKFVFRDTWLFRAEVPPPDARLNIHQALRRWREHVQAQPGREGLPFMQRWKLFLRDLDWARFWVVRWPYAEGRADWAELLDDLDAEAMRVWAWAERSRSIN